MSQRPKPMQSNRTEDGKTTRWYFRYHRAEHDKAVKFGGFEFGDHRCPVCQLWHRVWELKQKFRQVKLRLESNARRTEKLQDFVEKLGW
jgi:hypothetical protein